MLDLDLDLIETVILAVIWGFCQDGETRFRGSWKYLQNTAKCSRAKVSRTLKRLVEIGYVKKHDMAVGGVKLCEYYIDLGGGISERPPVSPGYVGGISERLGGGISERPNNEELYNSSNSINNNMGNASRFTPPTIDEVEAYCRDRKNSIDPQKFIDYYSANGWMVGKNHMKDWRAAVRNWETRDKEKINGTSRNIDKSSPAAYRHLGNGDYYGEPTL